MCNLNCTKNSNLRVLRHKVRAFIAVVVGVCFPLLSACDAPHIAIVDQQQPKSVCQYSLEQSTRYQSYLNPTQQPLKVARMRDAFAASQSWATVAVTCPERFEEGIVRSSQALHTFATHKSELNEKDLNWIAQSTFSSNDLIAAYQQALSSGKQNNDNGEKSSDEGIAQIFQNTLHTVDKTARNSAFIAQILDAAYQLPVPTETQLKQVRDSFDATSISSAEDQAGFAAATLAAHNAARTDTIYTAEDNSRSSIPQAETVSLADADRYYSIAALFSEVSSRTTLEPSYALGTLLNETNSMRDVSTGLLAPTMSVFEMQCARAILQGASNRLSTKSESSATTENDSKKNSDASGYAFDSGTTDAKNTANTSIDSATTGSNSAASTDDSNSNATKKDYVQSWYALAQLAQSHAFRALEGGYPSFDEALLQ